MLGDSEITFSLELRDMKYLSHKKSFNATISSDVLDNGATGQVPVDFTVITDLDEKGESKYVVGGRVYFEASIFGLNYNSFTYKGFFDQEGYTEPPSTLKQLKSSGLIWIIAASVVLLIILVYVICKCRSKSDSKKKSD